MQSIHTIEAIRKKSEQIDSLHKLLDQQQLQFELKSDIKDEVEEEKEILNEPHNISKTSWWKFWDKK